MSKLPTSFGLDERISFVEVKQTKKQTNKQKYFMSNVIQVGYWKKDHHNFIEPKWM